jgi:hypothetical protein
MAQTKLLHQKLTVEISFVLLFLVPVAAVFVLVLVPLGVERLLARGLVQFGLDGAQFDNLSGQKIIIMGPDSPN